MFAPIPNRWPVLFLALLFATTTVCASYRFDHWDADDGLPQNSTYTIGQTADGYLWMTTLDGLVRFDGVKFTVFNRANLPGLPSNRLHGILPDNDGTLWLATEDDGLVRWRDGVLTTFRWPGDSVWNRMRFIERDIDGSLIVSTQVGLLRFRDEQLSILQVFAEGDRRIYVSPSGRRWELSNDALRMTDSLGNSGTYPIPFKPRPGGGELDLDAVNSAAMTETSDGTLFLAADGRLFRLRDGVFKAFGEAEGIPRAAVRKIAADKTGGVWIGLRNRGVCRFDAGAGTTECFDTKRGLSTDNVLDVFCDREGTVWIGTDDGGINRASRQTVSTISVAEGLPDKAVYPIMRDGADVWIGTAGGLARFADGRMRSFGKREGLKYDVVQSLAKDRRGRLWIGSVGGVQVYRDGRFDDFTARLGLTVGDAVFWHITEDSRGLLWFATSAGLITYDGTNVRRMTTADGLPGDDVRLAVETRDGKIWAGTYSGIGVISADGAVERTMTTKDGLSGDHVRTIYEDASGAVWIGTYESGLTRLRGGSAVAITAENGLYSNGVFAIVDDGLGYFWISSNQGVYRVSRKELDDFADGLAGHVASTPFGKSDGMLNGECNGGRQPASMTDENGRIWFPTQDGVAIFDPRDVPFNPNPPAVVIESVVVEGAPVPYWKVLDLASSAENLEIGYTGPSFVKPEQVRFRYRLEGLDHDWIDAGKRRTAYFPYLPPGEYVFRVTAANSDNVWNSDGASLRLVVRPAFYQTTWFAVLAAVSVGAIAFMLYRYRLLAERRTAAAREAFSRRLMEAHESERRRIAAELHDSLGQNLAMIRNSAVFGSRTAEDLDAARRQLAEISVQSAELINEVREISYDLRPYLLDRVGLTRTLESMLVKLSEKTSLKVEGAIGNIDGFLDPKDELGLYRVIQECVNNVLRHADASTLRISTTQTDDGIELIVEDDGRGFDPASAGSGFGLVGMRERVRMLGGTISIDSASAKGTRISVRIGNENG